MPGSIRSVTAMAQTTGVTDLEGTLAGAWEPEQITVVRGARTGVPIIVAVHSTVLGPAIGGCRFRHSPSWQGGLTDALALSAAMTDKCSLADLDHGGGKTVAVLPPGPVDPASRAALVLDTSDVVGSFTGRYLTGPDIGTGPADMLIIFQRTGYAFCRALGPARRRRARLR